MICSLCKGKRRIRKKGAAEAVACPRCNGEGLLPTTDEIVELVRKGEACFVDVGALKWIAEVRAVLRRLSGLYGRRSSSRSRTST